MLLVLVLAVLAAAGLLVLQGRDIYAPEWLRARVEARLVEVMPDARATFGDIVMVLDEGWRPRARVRDVRLFTPDGTEIASFSELRASLALRPLLDGRLELKSVDLNGVFATLTRDAEGKLALSSGTGFAATTRRAENLAQMVADLDDLLLRPGLSSLTSVNLRALTLRYEDAMTGRAWTVDGGRLSLTRDRQALELSADLALLGGGAQAATLSARYTGNIDSLASEFGITLSGLDASDIATVGPAFAWLQALRAPISGALRGGVIADGTLAPLNATLQIGGGVIQPTPNARPIPIEGARSYFSYLPDQQLLRFDELSVNSKWVSGKLDGSAYLDGPPNGLRNDLVGQFQLTDLKVNPDDLYPEPVTLGAAEMDFRLSLSPFELRIGRLDVADQGRILRADGRIGAGPDGWSIAADGGLDGITPARLLELWPERLGIKTRTWISENVLAGNISAVNMAVRLAPGERPKTYLDFDFDAASVRFLKTMPPIEQGQGHATLIRDRFVVSVDRGMVRAPQGGTVDLAGSSFILPDVTVKGGPPAVARLRTRSTVTAALALLNRPPLTVMDRASLPVTIADGTATLIGTVSFPLLKDAPLDVVKFDVQGQLHDVSSTTLVKDRTLVAPLLDLTASNRQVVVRGSGRLDSIAFDTVWTQPVGKVAGAASHLDGTLELSERTLDTFNIALPPGSVRGAGTASFTLDLVRGNAPAFTLSSDLRGVTLSVPPLNWSKPAGGAGQLEIIGTLGPVPEVQKLLVAGPGLSAEGTVSLKADGALDRVRFDRLKVGDWLSAPVDIVGRGRGQSVGLVLRGGQLDLRRAEFGASASASSTPAVPLDVALDRLQITDTIAIDDLRGTFSAQGGLDGVFSGKVNGGTGVSGRVVPQDGRSAVRLTSADAGGVFASAGVLKQVRGGDLDLSLRPVGTGGAFDGSLKVVGPRVKEAPAMAALLNAISIVGLVNELNGTGIYFSEVDATFRLTPSRITLTKASAVGNSMGLSMDGVFATDTGILQMQGVISPVYLVNGIGSVLTRKGEGLIGFNYALTGPAKDPKVSVNPLSVLTPGMFRDLFRTPPPTAPRVEGEAPPPVVVEPAGNRDLVRPGEDR